MRKLYDTVESKLRNHPEWLAVYECPSTGRLYYKFDNVERNDAVELVAAAFGQTKEQYLNTPKT